jgi:hypothetical protein
MFYITLRQKIMATRIFERELDSYHFDKDDMIRNIQNICKKHNISHVVDYKYEENSLFPSEQGQFILRLKNHYYVVECDVLYRPRGVLRQREREVSKNSIKYKLNKTVQIKTRMFYEYVKHRIPDYWNTYTLQGIVITDEYVRISCQLFGNTIVDNK